MKNALLDDDGKVLNLIEGALPGLNLVPDDGTAVIGGTWDGSKFVAPLASPAVPESISPRQFRQALTHFDFRQAVEAAVSSSTDQDFKDWYEFTSEFQRHHPEVLTRGAQLGFTADQMDQVWTYGAGI